MVETARLGFDTSLTTRGFTGHEMMDPIGLVHMNGRVYDAELGRFLSADPFVQFPTNLQSWNRYSYVLNNPLSFTDPTGYFLGKLFKAVGNFFKKAFRAFGKVVKKALAHPIVRGIIQIVGCAITAPSGGIGCAAISAGLAAAAGGSIADALQAAAFAFAQVHVWDEVGRIVSSLAATAIEGAQLVGAAAEAAFTAVKSGVHGVVSGALSVAQGGSFQQGFIGGAVGAFGGQLSQGVFGKYGTGNLGNAIGRAAISGAAGCAGSVLAGGKCANGAVTAAFASLYNGDKCGQAVSNACGAGLLVGSAAGAVAGCAGSGPACVAGGSAGALIVGAAGCVAGAAGAAMTHCSTGGGGDERILYHYTNKSGMEGIVASQFIRASTSVPDGRDVRYGAGVYLSDIPPGQFNSQQLASKFIRVPNRHRFTHFVAIDTSGLNLVAGRNNVYVIPTPVGVFINGRQRGAGAN